MDSPRTIPDSEDESERNARPTRQPIFSLSSYTSPTASLRGTTLDLPFDSLDTPGIITPGIPITPRIEETTRLLEAQHDARDLETGQEGGSVLSTGYGALDSGEPSNGGMIINLLSLNCLAQIIWYHIDRIGKIFASEQKIVEMGKSSILYTLTLLDTELLSIAVRPSFPSMHDGV